MKVKKTKIQFLKLLENIKNSGKTIILITHDLSVVAKYSNEISIMYMGHVVERANVIDIFKTPKHPYTKALMDALPVQKGKKLKNIKGQPSPLTQKIDGCPFNPRCEFVTEICLKDCPNLRKIDNTFVACHNPL